MIDRKNSKSFIQLTSYLIIILLLSVPFSAWAEDTPKIQLTAEEKAWLAEDHNIRVTFSEHPPYFTFKSGKVAGIAVELLDTISRTTGIKLKIATEPHLFADELKGLIEHSGPDIITAIMPTLEREKLILFTKPFINSPRFIFTRDDAPFVSKINQLFGKKVSVIKDYVTHKYLLEHYPEIDLMVFDTKEKALRAVSLGKAFAFIGDLTSTPVAINQFGLQNLKAASPSGLPDHPLAMGIRKDWPELRNILDKALDAIPAEEKAAIINKWSTVRLDYGISFDDVLKWSLIVFISTSGIVLMFVFWNKQLSGKIKERTSELMASEARFRATFEQAAVGVAHVSTDGNFLRVNNKFCEIIGYSEAEIRNLTFHDITHPDDLDADLEFVRQVLDGEVETYSMDKRYFRKDGSIVWINLTVSLVFDREANPKYFVSVIKDISDRKQAEESLKQSHDFLEHLTSAVPDAIYSIKIPERTIEWANDSFNVMGYKDEEYIGQPVEKYYASHEEYQRIGALQQEAISKGKKMIRTEAMVRRKDGRIIPMELTATFFQKEGKMSNITAMVRDISERKMAEKDLQESEAKYRNLVDNSMVGVFSTTIDGRIIFVNEAMARIYDFDSPELMISQGSLSRWVDLVQREKMLALLEEYGIASNFEAENITNTGRTIHVIFSVKKIGENIIGMLMDITERNQGEIELRETYREIDRLQKQLQAESAYLQEEIRLEHNFENIIGQSEALTYVLHRVELVAPEDSTVLIMGETGTGKELIARALHQLSSRSMRPLVKVNCAALPGELIESELFGREKGAYTGAANSQGGRFELAHGSTLFLDEIGELPLPLQAKLLRVIESGEFERLGSVRTIKSNARIIAATNRNLEEEVRNNRFREDLLYRLKIFPITVPPLRDRLEDIPLLVDNFIQFYMRKMGKKATKAIEIPKRSMEELQSYTWPGNVRELKHIVEGAFISLQGNKLNFDIPKTADAATRKFKSFEDMEREYILEVLKAKNWKIGGEDSVSEILGMPSSTLRSRIKKLGLKRP